MSLKKFSVWYRRKLHIVYFMTWVHTMEDLCIQATRICGCWCSASGICNTHGRAPIRAPVAFRPCTQDEDMCFDDEVNL
jgi:hypothetical protein